MFRFLIGKAGVGKTAALIEEIQGNIKQNKDGTVLLVPEQYSHEAEREMCRICGNRLSLYAEVLSFTGLARKMDIKQGGIATPWLDKGGRMLCMALALQEVGPKLKVYSVAQRKPELQDMLLREVDELKTARIESGQLVAAAASCRDGLGDKLSDIALVLEAYETTVANGHADPADRLTILAKKIKSGGLPGVNRIYVDGFVDFTKQEQEVLFAIMQHNIEMTVCLTVDDMQGDSEIFELSRRTARILEKAAREAGKTVSYSKIEKEHEPVNGLQFFAEHMFDYGEYHWRGETPIRIIHTQNVTAECEKAAAMCIELTREKKCRWRDIAIVIRGFEDYRGTVESVFHHYGVPVFTAARSDLMSKPLPTMIASAYEIIHGGWALDDVISYIRTGLAGLNERECDELENYLFTWQLRGGAWLRKGNWRQHPEGYGKEYTKETEQKLQRINSLRRRVAEPMIAFEKEAKAGKTARDQARALANLFSALHLPDNLQHRAEQLQKIGRKKNAAEYRQLWEIIVRALEQIDSILGESIMDFEHFGRLFVLMLSKYDIGTIPISLDRVTVGDFDHNRRRDIKHLIVLGATDSRLPMLEEGGGIFSLDDRQRLMKMNIELGPAGDSELWREFALIYYTMTLPSESLIMSCPLMSADGSPVRAAFVFRRAQALFALQPEMADLTDARMSAIGPAMGLAAQAIHDDEERARAAAAYFAKHAPERSAALQAASEQIRGSLSQEGVTRLYGKKMRLSASRIEKFAACRFAYFCQYGLKAKPYVPAGFQPPEMGTFMHYVLENVAKEVNEAGGFSQIENEQLHILTDKYIKIYIHEELNDFQEKTSRFVYLFNRLRENVWNIVRDMAEELKVSDFVPLDFELDFSKAKDIPPIKLDENTEEMALVGVADRVDGWLHDGKLYIRVVDYKTGHKEFSLSDVLYGMNLQMLLYLFILANGGEKHYGHEIVPAGVMYIPARSPMISSEGPMDEIDVQLEREKELRRSGLLLDDPAMLEAWEHGDNKKYIPIKFRYNKPTQETLASQKKLGRLYEHIKMELKEMAKELHAGSIEADPFYRSQRDNACVYCDYADICQFVEGRRGEKSRFLQKRSPDEVWSIVKDS